MDVHGGIAHAFIKKGLVQMWPEKCTEVHRFSKRSYQKTGMKNPFFVQNVQGDRGGLFLDSPKEVCSDFGSAT